MRTLFIAAAAISLAVAGQSFAEGAKTTVSADPTHEQCKAVMGNKMDNKQPHDHGRDKTGMMTWPNGKPLTKAEMDKMHEKCAAKMAAAKK